MSITKIHLRQFRNYTDTTYEFSDRVTIITGKNGIGKTNILEALYVASTGKSFRDPDDQLIQHNKTWWRVVCTTENEERDIRSKDGQKSITINDKTFKRLSTQHSIPVVLFEPDHLMLLHGSPQSRRKYLDASIAVVTPGYATIVRRYERVLAQRNRLLKSPQLDQDQLFVWDVSLSELATKIVEARRHYIDGWNERLTTHYQEISGQKEILSVSYSDVHPTEKYTQVLLGKLRDTFDRDRMIGSTMHGPHRDDYTFYINKKDMVHTASRGEVRTLLLAMKYHEADQLEKIHTTPTLFLLDDVFSELDEARQLSVLSRGSDHQIVITTTELHHLEAKMYKAANILQLGQE